MTSHRKFTHELRRWLQVIREQSIAAGIEMRGEDQNLTDVKTYFDGFYIHLAVPSLKAVAEMADLVHLKILLRNSLKYQNDLALLGEVIFLRILQLEGEQK